MKVSGSERLILLMLCDLFQHFNVESEIDPAFVKEALLGDHSWALEWEGILSEATDRTDVADEVGVILSMWRSIEWSYEELSEQDKERVRAEAGILRDSVEFEGFDGNEETSHMAVAEFMVERMPKRFEHFEGRDLNSHFPSLYRHRPMVKTFREIIRRPGFSGGTIGAEDLIRILKSA